MSKTLVVAWREFRHTAMTKAFLIGALVMPLLMMGLFIVVMPLMMGANTTPLTGTVAVIAADDVFLDLQDRLSINENPNAELIESLPDIVKIYIDNSVTIFCGFNCSSSNKAVC